MKTQNTISRLGARLALTLASGLLGALALALSPGATAQQPLSGCSPCPGTLPAIWPERSAAVDASARILGWNLEPLTDYELVVVAPDRSVHSAVVKTDEEGDLLGDDERDDGQPWGTPYRFDVAPENLGVYEVRAYVFPWSGELGEPAVAATTLYHGEFGK